MCLEGLQVSVFLMSVTKCPFSDAGLGVKAISPSCPLPPPTLPPACWVGRRGDGGAEDPRGETVGQGHLQGVLRYCRRGGFKETEERLESSVDGV